MDEVKQQGIATALGRIPSGLFIMTAAHEDRRTGMLASWVQQACFQPPMVTVAVSKGRPIMPLISESRQFGLCQLPENDRLFMRKFASGFDPGEDPFLGFELIEDAELGAPLLAGCIGYMECELACHMDVEGDHDLFVGKIIAGQSNGGQPHIHLRENGFSY